MMPSDPQQTISPGCPCGWPGADVGWYGGEDDPPLPKCPECGRKLSAPALSEQFDAPGPRNPLIPIASLRRRDHPCVA